MPNVIMSTMNFSFAQPAQQAPNQPLVLVTPNPGSIRILAAVDVQN